MGIAEIKINKKTSKYSILIGSYFGGTILVILDPNELYPINLSKKLLAMSYF